VSATAMHPPVVIVGAGAAGLFAAAHLAGLGRPVIVLERGDRPARKVLAAGGARCNFTNDRSPEGMLSALPTAARRFLKPAMYELPSEALRRWFAERGVPSVVEDRRCVFPSSGRSRDVVEAMLAAARQAGADVRTGVACRGVRVEDGHVAAVRTDDGDLPAAAVLLACGGPAAPHLGGTDAGLGLLADLGHRLVPVRPGLTPLLADDPLLRPLQGITFEAVRLRLARHAVEGPALCAHFGLTGPAALDMSLAVDTLPANIVMSLSASCTADDVESCLVVPRGGHGPVRLSTALGQWLPRRVAAQVMQSLGIAPDMTLSRLTQADRRAVVRCVTGHPIRVTGLGDWPLAMVTVGGGALGDVEPRTMRSRKVRGLYVAGELLYVAGPTGGWNLHGAMATGLLAARAIRADLAQS